MVTFCVFLEFGTRECRFVSTLNYASMPKFEIKESCVMRWVLTLIFRRRFLMKSGYYTVNVDYLPMFTSVAVSKGSLELYLRLLSLTE